MQVNKYTAGIVKNTAGKVLLVKNAEGKWSFFRSDAAENQDDALMTAIKEAGVDAAVEKKMPAFEIIDSNNIKHVVTPVILSSGSAEGKECQWFSPEETLDQDCTLDVEEGLRYAELLKE
ncbi:NUDIX hydrolase [Candidatus Woesearchaeota archaeon]|nr:NUDIX hydrolase [Candidatus Woesearchaeota archaeon]